MKKPNSWTPLEIGILEDMFPTEKLSDIAKRLNRTEHSIQVKAYKMGLRRKVNPCVIQWTPQMLKLITTFFPMMSNKPLAKWLGISISTLRRKARELGLHKKEDYIKKKHKEIGQLLSESHKNNEKLKATQIKKGEHRGRETEFKKGQKMSPEMIAKRTATLLENKRRKKQKEIISKYYE